MRQLIFIFGLTLGLLSCNNLTEKNTETKLPRTDSLVIVTPAQTDTLQSIPIETKQKEYYKSTLATYWERSNKEFPFDGWLSKFKDKDSLQKVNLQIDSIIYHEISNQSFDLSDEWKLECYIDRGWHTMALDQNKKRNDCYYSKSNKFKLTGTDIFYIFKLPYKIFPLNNFPLIITHAAKFNGEWTAVLVEKNKLIIRLASCYPDVNQNSWQFEKLYLFTKTNE